MSSAEKTGISKRRYLEFERPLQDLDQQIEQLKNMRLEGRVDVSDEIKALETKSHELLCTLFSDVKPYQMVQLARHPDRPTSLELIASIFDDFIELSGDRKFMDDKAIVAGLASLSGQPVMVVGHQKGHTTQENQLRNFGMPRPEGYRKALRLFEMAEKWNLPIVTFIDTPGAYPGIEAEERGQAEAIAANVIRMTDLKVPIVSVVIGEGGSGGALAIAVADRLLMMQYSVYSVISPEGCAAITWKSGAEAPRAAEALKITAKEIFSFGVADEIIEEPLGGAHRDAREAARRLREALERNLAGLQRQSTENLLEGRYQKYRRLGVFSRSIGAVDVGSTAVGTKDVVQP